MFAKLKNWPFTKVYIREITKKFSNFLIFHIFLNDIAFKEVTIYVYIIKPNEVDSKNKYIKENFLHNL